MKKIFLLTGVLVLLLGSCVKDKGNYDYTMGEEPVVELQKLYMAMEEGGVRQNLVIEPDIDFSDLSKLRFVYEFFDASTSTLIYTAEGDQNGALDDPMEGIANGTYQARLTVIIPDNSGINTNPDDQGMKYYQDFTVTLGGTKYSQGSLVLVDDGGQARLHFVNVAGGVLEDVFAEENDGADLPGAPVQLAAPLTWMGGMTETSYYIMTNNGGNTDGVIIGADNMVMTGPMLRSMFPMTPASTANPGMILTVGDPNNSAGTPATNGWAERGIWEFLMDNKVYSMNGFMGGTIMFMPPAMPVAENISYITNDRRMNTQMGNMWGWDPVAKRLRWFYAMGSVMGTPMSVAPISMGGGDPVDFRPLSFVGEVWDPRNVGLDMLTLKFWNGGGWLIATDGATVYQLGFLLGDDQMNPMLASLSGLTKNVFPAVVTADSKWLIDVRDGVMFYSAGNMVYRYDPASYPSEPEPMTAVLDGEVTMLRFRTYRTPAVGAGPAHYIETYDFNTLEIGTEGHLYWLNIDGPKGNRGEIVRDIPMAGAPVDIYNRVEE